jgi:hypothetical protein
LRASARVIASITVAIFGANHMSTTMMSTARPGAGDMKADGRSAVTTPKVPSTTNAIHAGEPRNIRIAKPSW